MSKTKTDLSHDYLLSIMDYFPETGKLFWKDGLPFKAAGGEAGTLSKYGYVCVEVKGKHYMAHRLAWFYAHKQWPKDQIDHINHNRSDNRMTNLRQVTATENQKNSRMRKNNTSGFMGVSWHKRQRKWLVNIMIDYKHQHIGYFSDFFEACCARKSAERIYGFHANHGANNV